MAVLKSWKLGIGFLLTLCVVGFMYFGYFYCTGPDCALGRGNSNPTFKSNYEAYFAGKYLQNKFSDSELIRNYNINLENEDVIIFLHIQKTGGTVFGKHLVENLEVYPPCHCYKKVKKHCDCYNKKKQVWLFSRYSTGWRCGLHADWTELNNCVANWFQQTYGKKKRKYHYITILRDPVSRFISEWKHVQRGATWKTSALKCNGREATLEEVPFCYDSEDWQEVSLQEFMDCPHNLAFNRQTRMLANLTTVHCYNTSALTPARRAALLLVSAKRNLQQMSFFGLVEFQTDSQFLFEHSLHMRFQHDFVQLNRTHSSRENLTVSVLNRIAQLNSLDIELYQFAKDLFLQRMQQAQKEAGIPVSEHLERLIGQQAVNQEEMPEGGYPVPGEETPENGDETKIDGGGVLKNRANKLTENIVRDKLLGSSMSQNMAARLAEGGGGSRRNLRSRKTDKKTRRKDSGSDHGDSRDPAQRSDGLISRQLLDKASRKKGKRLRNRSIRSR